MRPNREFKTHLNHNIPKSLGKINVTAMRTTYGLMILPPNSYKINLGNEIQIPVLIHEWMVEELRTLTAISQALSELVNSHINYISQINL